MKRANCNVCNSKGLLELLDLGKHPLADTFLSKEIADYPEICYPLVLGECKNCGHILTLYEVSPEERYIDNDYSYDSSNSPVSEAHFKEFAEDILFTYKENFSGSSQLKALDIGSNVGTLLSYLKEIGLNVIGVEPSQNIAKIARERSIDTVCSLFDETIINHKLLGQNSFDLIVSTNVVNHIDDLSNLLKNVKKLGKDNCMFCFEVPYFIDLIKKNAFDTIYHEHVNYFTLGSVSKFLNSQHFSIISVKHIEYMGGSIRVFAKPSESNIEQAEHVKKLFKKEEEFLVQNPNWRENFRNQVLKIKKELLSFVHVQQKKGKRICCIGAATKGNTLLNYCKLDRDSISVCSDVSKLKVGKKLPGSLIPIIHDDELGDSWDYGIVLPWNLSDFLKDKFTSTGIKLIFPLEGNLLED